MTTRTTDRPLIAASAWRSLGGACALAIASLVAASGASAAEKTEAESRWSVVTRFVAIGSSDASESDPAGYKAYSAFTLEVGVRRQISRRLGLELSARPESREIDRYAGSAIAEHLGSAELLPINLLLQYRLGTGALRPYVGVGGNLTVCWEKSGELDSADLTPSVGPVLALGVDAGRSSRAHVSVDVRWNPLRTDLKVGDAKVARLKLDTLALGLGVGLRF